MGTLNLAGREATKRIPQTLNAGNVPRSPAEPVIAHFESLECAYEFLEAIIVEYGLGVMGFRTVEEL